ncbi:hypothetical protein SAMN06264346_1022 [Chryseobacterium profundimaris]|uniref:Uncharacterized protein n=1 Tax=Chryseobacterium profundimaris TaxID=1387275 RepID=A0ABY1NG90_9FLAO|nr:hypothetical protein SAMN06264346_1022 [Chryseobacterium profundimaris]
MVLYIHRIIHFKVLKRCFWTFSIAENAGKIKDLSNEKISISKH